MYTHSPLIRPIAPSLHRTDTLQDPYDEGDDEPLEDEDEEDEEVGAFHLNLTNCS